LADNSEKTLGELVAQAERQARENFIDELLVKEREYRCLRYVWVLNEHGYQPTEVEASAYFRRPDRELRGTSFTEVFRLIDSLQPKAAESALDYLLRLMWVEKTVDGRIRVTAVGRTVCQAVEAHAESESEDRAVVLDPADPFAYARFADQLGQLRDVLLVDPYFRLQQLTELHPLGVVARILIGCNHTDGERQALAIALPHVEGVPEIRMSAECHDRFLIPATGDVWQFGASTNGIGKKVSVITALGSRVGTQVRQIHEKIWDAAEPLVSDAQVADADALDDPAIT